MLLFHGSNVAVREPRIIITNRALDFGPGFYTTSDKEQAVRWAKLQTFRRREGVPTVTVYDYTAEEAEKLFVRHFYGPGKEWLEYVVMNRKNAYSGKKYDIVTGPVANDSTMAVINDYMSGNINAETALLLLKPQKLTDQFAFLTWKGLSTLTCLEVEQYE